MMAPAGAAPSQARRWVALFRGINVGRAKRLAMADLRTTLSGLGFGEVRTLLNSGNAVFTGRGTSASIAAAIEKAVQSQMGVSSRVTILTAAEVAGILAANPLASSDRHPSRLLVAVLQDHTACARLMPLTREQWSPEALSLIARVAYLWCPNGVADSAVVESVGRLSGTDVTVRNWATFTKIAAAAAAA